MSELQEDGSEVQEQIGLLENIALDARTQIAVRLLEAQGSVDDLIKELAGASGKQIKFKSAEPAEESEPDFVIAEVSDSTDAEPDKLNRLKQNLTAQYNEWDMNVQGNKPSIEQMLNSFTKEKLEVADSYNTPYLLMLPAKEDDSDKTIGFRPVIAEGKQKMEPYAGDDLNANLEDRIPERRKNRKNGEEGMTRVIYEPLFEAAKKAGKPIGRKFWTMLDDDYNEGDPFVSFAPPDAGWPNYSKFDADFPHDDVRFRSAVRGDVLNI